MSIGVSELKGVKILVSAISGCEILGQDQAKLITTSLKADAQLKVVAQSIAKNFNNSQLIRQLNLRSSSQHNQVFEKLDIQGQQVCFENQEIGIIKILFKSTLPGELQARLSTESIIERYLEYLQKVYKIAVLAESDRHVEVFVPNVDIPDFEQWWQQFLQEVAFSDYGLPQYQLPGLMQSFVAMLNSIKLAERGFNAPTLPIVTRGQAIILCAWYYAVWEYTKQQHENRSINIEKWNLELERETIADKDRKKIVKDIKEAQEKSQKNIDKFAKKFGEVLAEHQGIYKEFKSINSRLNSGEIDSKKSKKIKKEKQRLLSKIVFGEEFIIDKQKIFVDSQKDPFKFLEIDKNKNQETFTSIVELSKKFNKTAIDQIGKKSDYFVKCIIEIYRLLEILKNNKFDPLPAPVLTDEIILPRSRSPGDDHKEFCYACGVGLDPKKAKWQVLRFMFERPSQRRQSASGEGRPHICDSCALFAFASPLKVTDESIILKLEARDGQLSTQLKLQDYLRMLTCKEMNLNAGKYIVLTSDKTKKGDAASSKLGQVQYAIAKVSSLFSVEVLQDFRFSLITQGSEPIVLANRHLIFAKGIMAGYGQKIIEGGKDINMKLGDAIRYIQKDMPYLAEYSTTKNVNYSDAFELEKVHQLYWNSIQNDLGQDMNSSKQIAKRALLYKDVAALTGLTKPFVEALKYNYTKALKKKAEKEPNKYPPLKIKEMVEREMSKLIEKVDEPNFFGYYATLEVETAVKAWLWKNPDNYFIYQQTQKLLQDLGQLEREHKEEDGKIRIQLYVDDIANAYAHYSGSDQYLQQKDWKELTYQLKLSLYTRFPELVRKSKTSGEN